MKDSFKGFKDGPICGCCGNHIYARCLSEEEVAKIVEQTYRGFSTYGEDEYGYDQSEERLEYAERSAKAICELQRGKE